MTRELDEVKYEVAVANRILTELGLAVGVTASLGHASMRLPGEPDRFVVKGRGYEVDVLQVMRPQDMVVCDLEGNKIDGPTRSSQCSEVKIHSCIYRERPEVQSVVHVHPRYIVLMTTLAQALVPMCQEGAQLLKKPLPLYPHMKTVWSEEEGAELVKILGSSKAVLMQSHGATMTGRSLSDAVMGMQQLEEQARMNYLAFCAAGPDHPRVPEELIDEMTNRPRQEEYPHFKEVMKKIGGNPPRNGPWMFYRNKVVKEMEADMRG